MAFREVFLVQVPSTGAATLRQFGRYIYDTIAESRLQEAREPPVHAELRAVAEDLRFSARGLAHLGRDRKGSLTAEEAALSKKAESWAREILELVRAIEGASSGTGGTE